MTQHCSVIYLVKKLSLYCLLKSQVTVQMVVVLESVHVLVTHSYCNELLTIVHVHIPTHTFLAVIIVLRLVVLLERLSC